MNARGMVAKLFLLAPFVFGIGISAHSIIVTLRAAPAVSAAKLIEDGEPISSKALAELPASYFEGNGCYGPARRAAVTLALAQADQQNVAADYDAWAAAVAKAEATIKTALSCSPGDGNLWLRLAMTRFAAGEDPSEQVSLLDMSQQMEPTNPRILSARLSHWKRLSNPTLQQGEAIVGADISIALRYLDARKLGLLDPAENTEWQRIVASRIAILPEDRQRALQIK